MKRKILIFALIFLSFLVNKAWALGLEIAGGVWEQDPIGKVFYIVEITSKGKTRSVRTNLKYARKWKIFGRVKLKFQFIDFYFVYTPVHFEGKGKKDITFKLNGKPYNVSVPFNSYLTFDQYDIGIYWKVPLFNRTSEVAPLDFKGLNLELGLNMKIVKVKAMIELAQLNKKDGTLSILSSLSSLNLNKYFKKKEETSFTAYIPMLYSGLNLNLNYINLEGELRGIVYRDNYYYDSIARVKIFVFKSPLVKPSVFISLGYRYQHLKIDEKKLSGSFILSGFFAETGLRF